VGAHQPSDVPSTPTVAKKRAGKRWYVYLIECRSGAIYTGIAVDVDARYAKHIAGTGARYTRSNPPERLLATFACGSRSVASRIEAGVKKLSAATKAELAGLSTTALRKRLRT
jgi:putative endonuclease